MDWYMPQDKLEISVGINQRLWLLNKDGITPTLIRLGREHTRLFMKEACLHFIPNRKPEKIYHQNLYWDDENNQLCYSKRMVPIKFNDRKIYGIAVEGVPKPDKPKKPKNKSTD